MSRTMASRLVETCRPCQLVELPQLCDHAAQPRRRLPVRPASCRPGNGFDLLADVDVTLRYLQTRPTDRQHCDKKHLATVIGITWLTDRSDLVLSDG